MLLASQVQLYKKPTDYIPRIAAVHDLCGYGKCSLGVAIPVLSAAGCDVCPVPTSLFSAHTAYEVFYMHDTTSMLSDYLDAWKQENVDLDGVYSGFLGSAEQVSIIQRLYREYPEALRFVDPVMGDAGKIYPTYTDELCCAMRELVDGADLLTPNMTEAAFLASMDYPGSNPSKEAIDKIMDSLIGLGAHNVVLKGIVKGDGKIRNYLAGKDFDLVEVSSELLPFMLHGTGDLFASCCIAAIMNERDLQTAAQFASDTVRHAMQKTLKQPNYQQRGVSFETTLGELTALMC
ncbi:pyridoxamine kinase [Atopobium deltae]|uniref:pyridoxal kinase n=1 Tax=Atopobium deltae TaxID=1393034 RepID=A0A133XTZ3_9ACTN|nr:pyridoxamine kinase [Atopobium deltae]KXB34403.1 putative pyridoxal kinase [Atopobium deltae]